MRRNGSTLFTMGVGAALLLRSTALTAQSAAPSAGFEPAPADDPAPPPPAPSEPAPSPPPAPAAPPAYPPAQYPYPYPYPYPYGQPPGYGYPQPAWSPPPQADKKARLPPPAPHTAVRSSPFLNLVLGGVLVNRHYSSAFNPGVEAGLFIADRVRVAARVMVPLAEPDDDYGFDDEPLASQGFQPVPSETPSLIGALSLGFVAVDLPGFTLSPSFYAARSDVADYGTLLGIGLPFEWLTRGGLRVGFDFALVRAFGGEVTGQCPSFSSVGSCDPGELRVFDREAGNGFMSSFIIGWALSRPNDD